MKTVAKSHQLGLTAALLALAACGSVDEAKETLDVQGKFANKTNELSLQVDGIGCIDRRVTVTANQLTYTETSYDDRDCRGKKLGKIVTETSLNVGQVIPHSKGARALDLKIQKITLTPLHESWGAIWGLDASGECRASEIPVGETIDVTGRDCDLLGKFPREDAIFFTAFRLNNDQNVLEMTALPQDSLDNVGTKEEPKERNTDIEFIYERQ